MNCEFSDFGTNLNNLRNNEIGATEWVRGTVKRDREGSSDERKHGVGDLANRMLHETEVRCDHCSLTKIAAAPILFRSQQEMR